MYVCILYMHILVLQLLVPLCFFFSTSAINASMHALIIVWKDKYFCRRSCDNNRVEHSPSSMKTRVSIE